VSPPRFLFPLLCLAFVVSGFTALVYETMWVRYLRLFLGSASLGQVTIIVFWMGGLAAGSWIGARLSTRTSRLLRYYAVIELGIGLFALIFHPLFGWMEDLSSLVIKNINIPLAEFSLKLLFSGFLLILPMILIGMTFPVIASLISALNPEKTGKRISILYFANSLGGAAGAIISGFILIKMVGLPGSVILAGIMNILIGACFLIYGKKNRLKLVSVPISINQPQVRQPINKSEFQTLLTGFLTGYAIFSLEVSWIRMFNLLLGSMMYTFEIVISVMIAAMAAGSLIISHWTAKPVNHLKTTRIMIILLIFLSSASLITYSLSFDWLQNIYPHFAAVKNGFSKYMLFGFGLATIIIAPTALISGALFPVLMLRAYNQSGNPEQFGRFYAMNTAGAILGAVISLMLFPVLGIVKVFITGIWIYLVALLSTELFLRSGAARYIFRFLPLLIFLLFFSFIFRIEEQKLASGVFRYGAIDNHTSTLFYKDGITASVSLYETQSGRRVLSINGKPDASLGKGNRISGDETTQVLLGAMPFTLGEDFEDIAIIGLGSGKTGHVVLGFPEVEKVDIVEIEPAVAEAAAFLKPEVGRVFQDPRTHIIIDDARSFFNDTKTKYDLIISEPSNPWVSGVGGLFSDGFYNDMSESLENNGLLVQWIHLYELDIQLFASIMKTLDKHFNFYQLYFLDNSNLGLLASNQPIAKNAERDIFKMPGLTEDLSKIGLQSLIDIRFRYIGSETWLRPLFCSYEVPANTDFNVYLETYGPETRFYRKNVSEFSELTQFYLPLNEVFDHYKVTPSDETIGENYLFDLPERTLQAESIFRSVKGDFFKEQTSDNQRMKDKISMLTALLNPMPWDTITLIDHTNFFMVEEIALYTLPYLTDEKLTLIWNRVTGSSFYRKLNPEQKLKVDFYQAVALRDYPGMAALGKELLNSRFMSQPDCFDQIPWLYAIALFKTGKTREAVDFLEKFQPSGECFIHRILYSNFSDRLPQNQR